jgi:molecular chaperone GrpE
MPDRRQDHPEDRPRRSVRITDKRRVQGAESDARSASTPPSPTRGVGSGDASAVPDEEARGSSEGTPLVTEEGPSASRGDAQAAEYLEDLRRLKAEFENYRKRVLKEQTRAVELAAEPIMAKLLEVLDEFELALMAAERKPDLDRFLHGVELVYAKLTDILRSEGLERIDAEGRAFDPELHEALLEAEGEAEGEPYVADVLRPGYTLKGRVIRPAGVKVGRR